MIWGTLLLFVVSFVVTALLAPKPNIENARAQDLDPNSFPRASESSPIPLVLGRARVNGPNTMYYGGYRSVPITEKVKTGLFSSEKITKGYTYYMTLQMGICLGPADLYGVYIDEELVDAGGSETPGSQTFSASVGGVGVSPAGSDAEPVTYNNVVLPPETASSWASNPGDFMIDLLSIYPNQAAIDQAFAEETLSFTFHLQGHHRYSAALGCAATLHNKLWQIGFFSETSGGVHDVSDTSTFKHGKGYSGTDTGAFDRTTVYDKDVAGFPTGTTGIRYLRIRFVDFPFSSDTYFSATNGVCSGELGTPQLTLTVNHNWVDVFEANIFEPELFGGFENGGGWIGDYRFYKGETNQLQDSYLITLTGDPDIPAYNGIASVVFEDNNIGESPSLRKMGFDVGAYPTNISGSFSSLSSKIGQDINPAEALYEVMTSVWRGLGIPASLIDTASFVTAGDTLISEGFGISMAISATGTGKSVISEILRTIDGIMYQEPTTGKFILKLIREDYTAGSLTVYDEDDIVRVSSFKKSAWEDIVTEVRVEFSSRSKESNRIAMAQDMAVANMMGRRKMSSLSFPMIYDETVANTVAWRELSQLSVPLVGMDLEMNRNGYQIKPGDVFKVTWPEYGITELIMRAQEYDQGELLNNKVVIRCLEDKFGVGTVVFADPAGSLWTDPTPVPTNIVDKTVIELPYFLGQKLEFPVADGKGSIVPVPQNPDTNQSTGFSMRSGVATGNLNVLQPDRVDYPVTGVLSAEYDEDTGFATGLDATGITITSTVGVPVAPTGTEAEDGEIGLMVITDGTAAGTEWMAFGGVTDNTGGSYTLTNVRRGILGTRPLTHAASSIVKIMTVNLYGTGLLADQLLEDGTAYYKLMDIAGDITQDQSALTEETFALEDIADRPLRPRNLQIEGSRATVPFDAGSDPTFTVSWSPSNRGESTISWETDAAETPDQAEEYDVEVWIDGVDQTGTYGATSVTGTSQAIDLTGAAGGTGEVRVLSRRTGGDTKESVYYARYPFTLAAATMDSTTVTMDDSGTTMDQTS